MNAPILIRCEGSGSSGHLTMFGAMCEMCGSHLPLDDHAVVVEHDRHDILAMLKRGDFG